MAISIRINTLKTDTTALVSELTAHGISLNQTWIPNAFVLEGTSREVITGLESYRQGLFYIQNLSSMIPALVLDPQRDEQVLDMCAAPGSKTTQLAGMMGNTGELVANDASRSRMFKLKALLEQHGVTNVTLKNTKGEFLWRTYPDYFDRVLVDAPCSMDQELPQKKIKHLAKLQTFLLRSAIACVKPGGRIVYSTCTSTREENEGVVKWMLEHEEVEIKPIQLTGVPNEFMTPEGFIRIENHDAYESFFVTSLCKKA